VNLLTNNLHQHALAPHAIELPVEDLFPRTEVQFPIRHRNNHLTSHYLALEMRVGVVLAGAVVPVITNGVMGSESFQPGLVVVMEAAFVKLDQIYTKLT
jgi:hypothetical protein